MRFPTTDRHDFWLGFAFGMLVMFVLLAAVGGP